MPATTVSLQIQNFAKDGCQHAKENENSTPGLLEFVTGIF